MFPNTSNQSWISPMIFFLCWPLKYWRQKFDSWTIACFIGRRRWTDGKVPSRLGSERLQVRISLEASTFWKWSESIKTANVRKSYLCTPMELISQKLSLFKRNAPTCMGWRWRVTYRPSLTYTLPKVQSSQHRFFCWKGCLKIIGWFNIQGPAVNTPGMFTELIRSGWLNLDKEKTSPNIVF